MNDSFHVASFHDVFLVGSVLAPFFMASPRQSALSFGAVVTWERCKTLLAFPLQSFVWEVAGRRYVFGEYCLAGQVYIWRGLHARDEYWRSTLTLVEYQATTQ